MKQFPSVINESLAVGLRVVSIQSTVNVVWWAASCPQALFSDPQNGSPDTWFTHRHIHCGHKDLNLRLSEIHPTQRGYQRKGSSQLTSCRKQAVEQSSELWISGFTKAVVRLHLWPRSSTASLELCTYQAFPSSPTKSREEEKSIFSWTVRVWDVTNNSFFPWKRPGGDWCRTQHDCPFLSPCSCFRTKLSGKGWCSLCDRFSWLCGKPRMYFRWRILCHLINWSCSYVWPARGFLNSLYQLILVEKQYNELTSFFAFSQIQISPFISTEAAALYIFHYLLPCF